MANDLVQLPPTVLQRGLNTAQWNTLCNSIFPGAKTDSVLLAVDYCKARGLDVMKKPCHIVPISVRDGESWKYRDVIMPGIYELRTTAMRTGLYLGHSPIEYGPEVEQFGLLVPESAQMVVFRWNDKAVRVTEFPVRVLFREVVNLKNDKPNQRWAKAPVQMMDKCLEAAGLRKAFPEELGGQYTDDEMEGRAIDVEVVSASRSAAAGDADAQSGGERRGRGKPATREPQATRRDPEPAAEPVSVDQPGAAEGGTGSPSADQEKRPGDLPYDDDHITRSQKAILEKRLGEAHLTTAQFCEAYKIAHIELLPFDMVENAKLWIARNAAK